MKNVLIAAFVLVIGIHISKAKPVLPATAQKVAESFYKKSTKLQSVNLTLAYTEKSANGLPVYYAFNVNTNDGFVIVTADDAAHPIIGYSTKNKFVVPQAKSNIAGWLNKRKLEVEDIRIRNVVADKQIANEWAGNPPKSNNRLSSNASTASYSIAPLCQTTWNQSPGYNDSCPGGSVTGCVATAMAQVMKYWNYPTTGTGSSSYCDCTSGGFSNQYGTLSANYGTTTYNWATMPLTGSNTDVAQLMYDCGVSVDMDYSPNGSGAWVITADDSICSQRSYVKYFGYNPYTIQGLYRTNFVDSVWTQMMINELINGRVVQYVGANSAGEGHTWVLDGVDTNNYFHMNWGWGGYDDGFFSLNNLLTTNGGFNPSIDHEALIGIEPMPHHAVDAGILTVTSPSGVICSNVFTPTITLQNFGSSMLTSCTLNFQLDNNTIQTQSWTGSLAGGQSTPISLSTMTVSIGTHSLTCFTSNPNGVTDSNSFNNQSIAYFSYATTVNLTAAFSNGQSTLCFVPAPIHFINGSLNAATYNWSFGDGTTNTSINPMHTYTASGAYNVKLITTACAGNLKDSALSTITITTPAAPTAISYTTTCTSSITNSSTATLTATGSETIVWKDSLGNQVGTGSTFVTPTLTANTTYYAVNTNPFTSVYGAPTLNTTIGAGAYINASHSLVFNANQAIILQTVDIYAQNTSAQPIIQLLDNLGNTIQSYTPTISASGVNTINLNWTVPMGTGYALVAAGNNINLYRNALNPGAVPYPYNIGSLVSITGDDVDSLHYYYFYNWQVAQEACTSPAVPVAVVLANCTGINQVAGNNEQVNIYPNPAKEVISIDGLHINAASQITITDMLGNTVKQSITYNSSSIISVSDLAEGIYNIGITTNKGVVNKRLVIVR
ncbi:MAG: C10 family peptidase [Bacteroidia bacterium]